MPGTLNELNQKITANKNIVKNAKALTALYESSQEIQLIRVHVKLCNQCNIPVCWLNA